MLMDTLMAFVLRSANDSFLHSFPVGVAVNLPCCTF
jgi:hypothetical protein